MREILVARDKDELNAMAAAKFVEIADSAITNHGQFTVALAGGSTPKSLYRLLAGAEFKDSIDWLKVFFFFGDERYVPPTDPESNFRMARETLFDSLQTPVENIFRWPAESAAAEQAAEEYEKILGKFFSGTPRFDLVLLGVGADGHTASLFPYTEALAETSRSAVSNWVQKLGEWRLTMTFRALNAAANVIFLANGDEKAPVLKEILEGPFQPEKYPAQGVKPDRRGHLYYLLDEAAARLLAG
jgi:6-phosphogluconolactonase